MAHNLQMIDKKIHMAVKAGKASPKKKKGPKDVKYVNQKEQYEVSYESKRKQPAKKFGSKKEK